MARPKTWKKWTMDDDVRLMDECPLRNGAPSGRRCRGVARRMGRTQKAIYERWWKLNRKSAVSRKMPRQLPVRANGGEMFGMGTIPQIRGMKVAEVTIRLVPE